MVKWRAGPPEEFPEFGEDDDAYLGWLTGGSHRISKLCSLAIGLLVSVKLKVSVLICGC